MIDILLYQYTENPQNLPDDWPAEVRGSVESDPLDPNWIRMTDENYLSYISDSIRVAALNARLVEIEQENTLKISSIVDSRFAELPTSKIDFRRHLQDGVYLNKRVTMSKNGRPVDCIYHYNGTDYAKVRFEFTTNSFNLLTNKKTYLGYHNALGTITQEYLLTDESNNLSELYGLQKAVTERYKARQYIFDEIKSFVNAVILQVYTATGRTYQEVLTDGSVFWKEYSSTIDSWCHIGDSQIIINKITADATTAFLDIEFTPGVTLRAWIIDRLTY